MPKGWCNHSREHALAARGISTRDSVRSVRRDVEVGTTPYYRVLILEKDEDCPMEAVMEPEVGDFEVVDEDGEVVFDEESGRWGAVHKSQRLSSFSHTPGGALVGGSHMFLFSRLGNLSGYSGVHGVPANIAEEIEYYDVCLYRTFQKPNIMIESDWFDFEVLEEVRYTVPTDVSLVARVPLSKAVDMQAVLSSYDRSRAGWYEKDGEEVYEYEPNTSKLWDVAENFDTLLEDDYGVEL